MPTANDKNAAAAKAVAAPAALDPEELVSVYNRNPRFGDFVHHDYEELKTEDGRVYAKKPKTEWRAEAGAFCRVPRRVAEIWKKQAPTTIVDSTEVGAPRTGFNVADDRVKKLETDNQELVGRIKALEEALNTAKMAQ